MNIINRLECELEKFDFHKTRGANGNDSLEKNIGFIRFSIWMQNVAGGKYYVNLQVLLKDTFDQFSDDPYESVKLGRLSNNNVVLPEQGEGGGMIWPHDQYDQALDAMLTVGIPWFEKNSDLACLAAELEKGPAWDDQTQGCMGKLRQEIGELILFRKKIPAPKSIIPPGWHKRLSLMYFYLDNLDAACVHAEEWLAYCTKPGQPPRGEPERTLYQIEQMGCREKKSEDKGVNKELKGSIL